VLYALNKYGTRMLMMDESGDSLKGGTKFFDMFRILRTISNEVRIQIVIAGTDYTLEALRQDL